MKKSRQQGVTISVQKKSGGKVLQKAYGKELAARCYKRRKKKSGRRYVIRGIKKKAGGGKL